MMQRAFGSFLSSVNLGEAGGEGEGAPLQSGCYKLKTLSAVKPLSPVPPAQFLFKVFGSVVSCLAHRFLGGSPDDMCSLAGGIGTVRELSCSCVLLGCDYSPQLDPPSPNRKP